MFNKLGQWSDSIISPEEIWILLKVGLLLIFMFSLLLESHKTWLWPYDFAMFCNSEGYGIIEYLSQLLVKTHSFSVFVSLQLLFLSSVYSLHQSTLLIKLLSFNSSWNYWNELNYEKMFLHCILFNTVWGFQFTKYAK